MKHDNRPVQRGKKFLSGTLSITFLTFCYSKTVAQKSTEGVEFSLSVFISSVEACVEA